MKITLFLFTVDKVYRKVWIPIDNKSEQFHMFAPAVDKAQYVYIFFYI